MKPFALILASAVVASSGLSAQELPSPAEMWAVIQQQQKQIAELQAALARVGSDVATTRGAVEATRTEVAATQAAVVETQEQVALTADALAAGTGAGASPSWADRTYLGGYGEMHLTLPDGGSNTLDYHRFVLFVNHDFTDSVRLVSELELEHSIAGEGQPGEIELEQAYVEFDLGSSSRADVGLFLMPVGLLNETHEPTTFYGVERNKVESRIIPTTWWEGGIAYRTGFENGLSLDVTLTSGLDHAGGVIRSGRQKVGSAIADAALGMVRVQYTGIPGLKVGATVAYQSDIAQSAAADTQAVLFEGHLDYRVGGFGLRALYAEWNLHGPTILASAERQLGYYLEPSYRFATELGDVGFFVRFSHYEYQRSATAFRSDDLWETGVNYWPIEAVVLKLDYQYAAEAEELAGDHWYNVGVGFHF